MSRGKDIRANLEDMLENSTWEWLQTRTKDNKKGDPEKYGYFKGQSAALANMRDPEDAENPAVHRAVMKEFIERVKD